MNVVKVVHNLTNFIKSLLIENSGLGGAID